MKNIHVWGAAEIFAFTAVVQKQLAFSWQWANSTAMNGAPLNVIVKNSE